MEAPGAIVLDVRTRSEYAAGHIPGARLIPHTELVQRAPAELPDRDAVVLVYCRSGARSAYAARRLIELGYNNVFDLGGLIRWDGPITR